MAKAGDIVHVDDEAWNLADAPEQLPSMATGVTEAVAGGGDDRE